MVNAIASAIPNARLFGPGFGANVFPSWFLF
jgi:hypothetical protein